MKRFSLIITVLLPFLLSGQSFKVYHEVFVQELNRKYQIGRTYPAGSDIFVFNNTGKLYEIEKGLDKTDKRHSSPSYLTIRTLNEDDHVLSSQVLKDNDIDSELARFGEMYIGQRKFIIIHTRFSFAIFNLSTNKLIIPNYSINRPEVEPGDAQSYNLAAVWIFDQGQYLICSIGDFGLFCFNLRDLYNPVLIEAFYTNPPFSSPYFFFLDHRKDDIYNGICVENDVRRIVNVEYLFKGLRFQQNEYDTIRKHVIDEQFIVLKQVDKAEKLVDLIIDYINGRLLDDKTDKELITNLKKGMEN